MRNIFEKGRSVILFLLMICALNVVAQFKTVGYMPSWAGNVSDIQFSKLTHINYSFALPTSTGGLQALENPSKLQSLVSAGHANNVKVLIAVGGWNNGDDSAFESLAANSTYRNNFVNNLVNLVNQYSLDGVDIDWEYPDGGASSNNFSLLMQQLSSAMHTRGKLLTAAVVAVNGSSIQSNVFGYVDFLNLMAYDGGGSNHSTYDYAVQSLNYWKGRGLPASKAILGVPFYGRSSTEYVNYNTLLNRGASPNSDFFGNIGYNGIPTIKNKTNLAWDQGGGIMIWELSGDVNNSNSLLSAINQVVVERSGGGGCSGSYANVPATLQAENYCLMSGIQTESTTDTGGGLNVGYIDAGDYMGYRINVPSAGTYTIQYRVASQSGGGSIRFERLGGGTVFGTISVPSTGGWQVWTTISHNVQLPAGQQEVAIAAATGGFNINWFGISGGGGGNAPIGQVIWLRGNNNQYVSGENGTQAMRCNRATVGTWEQFTVLDAGGGKIALRSMGKYVSSENGAAAMTCARTTLGDWEKFDWVVNADGKISLRGNNARYVSSENGAQAMTCNRTAIGGWEAFTWGAAGGGSRTSTTEEQDVTISDDEALSVFPNPSLGQVTIRVNKPSWIRIIDVIGNTVLSTEVKESLVVERMRTGLYFVNMSNAEKRAVKKLIVK
jgi:GH18 family chitinase